MRASEIAKLIVVLAALLAGCQEPRYRTEVKGNGQGGVEIQRVAKEPTPAPPPTTSPAPARAESLEAQLRQQQAQIDALQSQVQNQNEEIRRLKQPPTTSTMTP